VLITLLLIATNIWGYVPLGALLRNRFYLPFLVAVSGMFISLIFVKRGCDSTPVRNNFAIVCIVSLIALLSASGAFLQSPGVQSLDNRITKPFTVMTYNMQQGSLENGDRSYTKQLELLQEINPDILALQECDTARPSGGNVDAVRFFAESMGYRYVYYGPNTVSGTFGTAILARHPISNSRTLFTYSDIDEIGTAVCEIGGVIKVFCCHPAGGTNAKNAMVDAVNKEITYFDFAIVLGDFNFTPGSSPYNKLGRMLKNSAMEVGLKNVNFHGDAPDLSNKIDHIFISRGFTAIESHYLPPPQSQTDHPAHWSVIKPSGHRDYFRFIQ